MPPFASIEDRHFRPAFDAALAEPQGRDRGHRAGRPSRRPSPTPSRRWSAAGPLLDRVAGVFFNLTGAHTNDALQAIEREIAPLLAAPSQRHLSERQRCSRASTRSSPSATASASTHEQARVLERYHIAFVRAGAGRCRPRPRRGSPRSPSGSPRSARSSARTCSPTRRRWTLVLDGEADLAGLPDFARRAAAAKAAERARPRRASTSSPCRAPRSSRSCSSRPAAICARQAFEAWTRARRERRRDRQPRHHRRDRGAARRARAAARLRELRRISGSTTPMAKTPERVRWSCSMRCGRRRRARAVRRARRRCRRWSQPEGGNFDHRGLGLALLCREGAQGRVRPRRGRAQALPAARPDDRGRLRHGRAGCSA